jgi:hypothetical protein
MNPVPLIPHALKILFCPNGYIFQLPDSGWTLIMAYSVQWPIPSFAHPMYCWRRRDFLRGIPSTHLYNIKGKHLIIQCRKDYV